MQKEMYRGMLMEKFQINSQKADTKNARKCWYGRKIAGKRIQFEQTVEKHIHDEHIQRLSNNKKTCGNFESLQLRFNSNLTTLRSNLAVDQWSLFNV